MKTKKIPMRRCVGCGESKTKKELIRIVCSPSVAKQVINRSQAVWAERERNQGAEYISVITWNVLKRPINLMDWKDR